MFQDQPQGINSACEGLVWRIDVGVSRAFDPQPEYAAPFRAPQALEIKLELTAESDDQDLLDLNGRPVRSYIHSVDLQTLV